MSIWTRISDALEALVAGESLSQVFERLRTLLIAYKAAGGVEQAGEAVLLVHDERQGEEMISLMADIQDQFVHHIAEGRGLSKPAAEEAVSDFVNGDARSTRDSGGGKRLEEITGIEKDDGSEASSWARLP